MTTIDKINQLLAETTEGGNTKSRVADILKSIITDYTAAILSIELLPGAMIFTGTGIPKETLGNVGDLYLGTFTSDIYQKTGASTWTKKCNIKGATGFNGSTIIIGEGAPPNGSNPLTAGAPEDLYINVTTYDIYKGFFGGIWTLTGNIKGDPGASAVGGLQAVWILCEAGDAIIDLGEDSNIFFLDLTSVSTIKIINSQSKVGFVRTFELHIQVVTPTPVIWHFNPSWTDGIAPTIEGGKTSVFVFRTTNGIDWIGHLAYTYN
jgi:hypothetical protein